MENRIRNLKIRMAEEDIHIVLIFQNRDFYYFTGTQQNGFLIVPKDEDPLLFIRRNFERATYESHLKSIIQVKSLKEIKRFYRIPGYKVRIGIEEDVIPLGLFKRIKEIFKLAEFVDITPIIRRIRAIKDKGEIDLIKKSGEINTKIHREAKQILREGIREDELYFELEHLSRRLGDEHAARSRDWNSLPPNQIGSGIQGSLPSRSLIVTGGKGLNKITPHGFSKKKIYKGESVFIDWVSSYEGYATDQTRTYFVEEPDKKIIDAYYVCMEIYNTVKKMLRPGQIIREIYKFAVELAKKRGYSESFLGWGDYKVRFLGHGIGLELDEYPPISDLDEILKENMTVAIEPKISSPNWGAVGIEDTFLITKKDAISLTNGEIEPIII
jgi:Xaa-Pro aminopeptidase